MFNHSINKQVFEFKCNSEMIAENIQKEFTDYIAPQINDLISDILSSHVFEESTLSINEIEIDLGDVNIQNFGKDEMLNKFKTILSKKIANIQNPKQGITTVDIAREDQIAAYDTNLEITKSFILHNDVPWWMDKSMAIDPDAILKELITRNPRSVKSFLESQRSDKIILLRIATQYKPSTKAMINALIPGFLPVSFHTILLEEHFNKSKASSIHFLAQMEKLMPVLYKHTTASTDTGKVLLLRKLLKENNFNWINDPVLLDFFSREDLAVVYAFLPDNSKISRHAKMKVRKLLKKLSPLQLEFLYQYVSNKSRPSYQRVYPANRAAPDVFNIDTTDSADSGLNKLGESVPAYINTNANAIKDRWNESDTSFFEVKNIIVKNQADQIPSNPQDGIITPAGEIAMQAEIKDTDIEPAVTNIAKVSLSAPGFTPPTNKPPANEEMDIVIGAKGITNVASALDNFENNAMQENGLRQPLSSEIDENSRQPSSAVTSLSNESATNEEVKTIGEGDRFNYGIEVTKPVKGIKQENQISFLLKGLGCSSQSLFEYLKKLNKADLDNLKKAFTRHIQKGVERKKTVNTLLEHPHFLLYNLLPIFATFSFSGTDPHIISSDDPAGNFSKPQRAGLNNLIKKIKISQSLVLTALNNLSPGEIIILQDILQKKAFDTKSEKNLMRKILLKFPEDVVFLFHSLTSLPENELLNLMQTDQKFLSVNSSSTAGKYFPRYKDDQLQKYYIANAGLCLIAPYLSAFFNRLEYLENRVFKNKFIATRALFILQYMTSGNYKAPEYLLQLNKILCGFNLEEGITVNIRLSKKEMTEADNLIQSVITNWKVLKNTTVQGFRESFFQRKGILFQNELSWTLQVEKKGFDLLLNTIPWGFNIIKLPWMKKMLQVEW